MNDQPATGSTPSICVVMPAYRAESTLGAAIDGLFAAGFSSEEVVVVDDGSPDGSAALARGRGVRVVAPGGNNGASRARNAGVAATSAEIVFFVDSDVVVHDDVRPRLESFFETHPNHAGVFGSYDDSPPDQPAVSRIRNLLHHHVHQRSAGPVSTFWTGCGALRRSAFEIGGGFRTEDEMIEDVGLGLRLARAGQSVILDPDLECTHLKRWTWRGFARTDYRHRAMPWTRMMRDPGNGDLLHVLNAGARGKAAVVSVGLTLLALPLMLVSLAAGLVLFAGALVTLLWLERTFLKLVLRRFGAADATTALAVLWLHYLAAGAGYARVRVLG